MDTVLFTKIPIKGEVVAGRPIQGEEVESGCIAVELSTIGLTPTARTFALKVRGDSMLGAHILDGDTVVLEIKNGCRMEIAWSDNGHFPIFEPQ